MRSMQRIVLAIAVVALAVPLSSAAQRPPALGFAKGSGHLPCNKGTQYNLDMQFSGRMRAGLKAVTVTAGEGHGTSSCGNPLTLAMTGATPAGPLAWSCTGTLRLSKAIVVGSTLPPEVNDLGYELDYSDYAFLADQWAGAVSYNAECTTLGIPGSFKLKVFLLLDNRGVPPWDDVWKPFSSPAGLYTA